jgi:hypothetical protein
MNNNSTYQHNPITFILYYGKSDNPREDFIRTHLEGAFTHYDLKGVRFDNLVHELFSDIEEFDTRERAVEASERFDTPDEILEISFVEFVDYVRAYMLEDISRTE